MKRLVKQRARSFTLGACLLGAAVAGLGAAAQPAAAQFTSTGPWTQWGTPNSRFPGVDARVKYVRAGTQYGHYLVQFRNRYQKTVAVAWRTTPGDARDRETGLSAGVFVSDPVDAGFIGYPGAELFINIMNVLATAGQGQVQPGGAEQPDQQEEAERRRLQEQQRQDEERRRQDQEQQAAARQQAIEDAQRAAAAKQRQEDAERQRQEEAERQRQEKLGRLEQQARDLMAQSQRMIDAQTDTTQEKQDADEYLKQRIQEIDQTFSGDDSSPEVSRLKQAIRAKLIEAEQEEAESRRTAADASQLKTELQNSPSNGLSITAVAGLLGASITGGQAEKHAARAEAARQAAEKLIPDLKVLEERRQVGNASESAQGLQRPGEEATPQNLTSTDASDLDVRIHQARAGQLECDGITGDWKRFTSDQLLNLLHGLEQIKESRSQTDPNASPDASDTTLRQVRADQIKDHGLAVDWQRYTADQLLGLLRLVERL